MKKTIRRFTLVEMLTVVAIIGILAGLIIPTVIIAQNRGRETQAKTDISSIMTALKQLKSDYNRCLVRTGTASNPQFHVGGKEVYSDGVTHFSCNLHSSSQTHYVVRIDNGRDSTNDDNAYDAMIAELSAPKNAVIRGETQSECVNRRRKTYLDPKSGFNPAVNYNTADNLEKLWRDPWGNPYVIFIGVDADHRMVMPNGVNIASGLAVYSFGPNGTDDGGCHSSLDEDECTGSGNHKNHDDIASWRL